MKMHKKFYEPKNDVMRGFQASQSQCCIACSRPLPDGHSATQVYCSLLCEKADELEAKQRAKQAKKRGRPRKNPFVFGKKTV